ncbi:hypothetical protein [Myxococcus sp. SDU36]|nr:hypothetical protein [Myxococcus sp. SDU36]WIG97557.1 hypothetical protein KGD87_09330 [Myxococcus sp. SDU36]
MNNDKNAVAVEKNESLLVDEFEIIELEDRLELAGRCNGRCDAQVERSVE